MDVLASSVRIEDMSVDDIGPVHEIERRSFATPWPPHAFREELTGNRMARYIVARAEDGAIAGYAGLWVVVDEGHITTFAVHPDFRRRGIAKRMLVHLADMTISLGGRRMTLEVRPSNQAAKALYEQFGFAAAGVRHAYYTDDGEDAIVMTTPALDDPAQQARIAGFRALLGDR